MKAIEISKCYGPQISFNIMYCLLTFLFCYFLIALCIYFNQFILSKYLQKVNPYCQNFFQYNKDNLIFLFIFI